MSIIESRIELHTVLIQLRFCTDLADIPRSNIDLLSFWSCSSFSDDNQLYDPNTTKSYIIYFYDIIITYYLSLFIYYNVTIYYLYVVSTYLLSLFSFYL